MLTDAIRKAVYRTAYRFEGAVPTSSAESEWAFKHPKLRVCVVKQDVYNDLYLCGRGSGTRDLILSSLKRSGPVGLFTELGADFRIVRTRETAECQTWQQKWTDCRQRPLSYYYNLQADANPFGENTHKLGQAVFAESPEEVTWSDYNIVISLDIAIPAAVTRLFPEVLWCYWISEPCMRAYRESHRKPVDGYNVFLNQRFWQRSFFRLRQHEINFPYAFSRSGCLADMFKDCREDERLGVMVESHSKDLFGPEEWAALERFGPVRMVGGTIEDILKGLHKSKYWLRLRGRFLWGNGMAEAIACGCVALGDPGEFKNRSLFTRFTACRSFKQAVEKVSLMEADRALYMRERVAQAKLLDFYCFRRPLNDLLKRYQTLKSQHAP